MCRRPGKTQIKWMCGLYPFLVSRCPHPKKAVDKQRSNEALGPAKDSAVTIHPHSSWRKVRLPIGLRRKFTAKVQWEQCTRLHLAIHSFSATQHSPSGGSNPQVIANINFLAEFPKEMRLRQSFFLAGFPNNFEPTGLCQPSGIDRQTLCCYKFYRNRCLGRRNLFPTKGKAAAWDHHLGIRGSTQKRSSFGQKSSSVYAYDTKHSVGTATFRDIRLIWPRWKPAGDPASLVPKPVEALVPHLSTDSCWLTLDISHMTLYPTVFPVLRNPSRKKPNAKDFLQISETTFLTY